MKESNEAKIYQRVKDALGGNWGISLGISETSSDSEIISQVRKLAESGHMPKAFFRAFYILGIIGTKEAAEVLLEFLQTPDKEMSFAAVIHMGELDYQALFPQLILLLEHPITQVRANAMMLLGKLVDIPEVKRCLTEKLYSDDVEIIGYAAESLGKTGEAQFLERYLALLDHDLPSCRAGAADALGRLKYVPVVPRLISIIDDEVRAFPLGGLGPSTVGGFAAFSLAQIGTPEAIRAYQKWRRKFLSY
jgi:HEAT repeat protein